MVNVEFCRREREREREREKRGRKQEKTHESMWKTLSDNITYWKLNCILDQSE